MKKSQLKEIIREVIEEELMGEAEPKRGQRRAALGWGAGSAGDQAKQMGLDYLGFGRYGKDGKTTHHSVDGKLQAVKPQAVSKSSDKPKVAPSGAGGKVPPSDTPKTKTTTPASDSEYRFGPDTTYLQVRKGATPAQRKLVGKVANMYDKVATSDWLAQHMGKSMPAAEFEKMTGISPKAAKAFSAIVDDYEIPFQYWDDDNIGTEGPTVYIADPMDV